MNRRQFVGAASLLSAATLIDPLQVFAANNDAAQLIVLHTNDMHSQIEPLRNDGRKYAGLGGMEARAAFINSVRKEKGEVLLLDAGDVFQGTPYFNYFGGELEYKLMSAMGYDACTLGNHDFDNGIAGLVKAMEFASFPIVNANYNVSKTALQGKIKPYIIKKTKIGTIGIFGLGIDLNGLVPDKNWQGLVYTNPVAVAKEIIQELKTQKVDMIICLSHLGFESGDEKKITDLTLAAQVEGIDLIIGGHTHTFLPKPVVIPSSNGNSQTIINQVGWAGIQMGRLNYKLAKNKSVQLADNKVVNIKSLT